MPDTTQPQLTTEGDEDGIFFVAGMVKYGWYMFYIYVLEKDDNNDVDDTDDDDDMLRKGITKRKWNIFTTFAIRRRKNIHFLFGNASLSHDHLLAPDTVPLPH